MLFAAKVAKFGGWLEKNKDSLLMSVFTFVLATTTSVGLERYFKIQDDAQARLEQQASTLNDEAGNFPTFMSRYVYSVVEGHKVDPKARQLLVASLVRQMNDAKDLIPNVNSKTKDLLRKYMLAIEQMNDAIPGATDVLHMKDFWEKASKLATLQAALRRRLPS